MDNQTSQSWYARIGDPPSKRKVRHSVGFPRELGGGGALAEGAGRLPWPAVVVLEQHARTRHCTLFRFSAKGEFAGDTWHLTLDDAREQAEYEFGSALGRWNAIPEGVPDPQAYARDQVLEL